MTDLDELLQRDGRRWQAEFQPPELAAMVATATRPAPHEPGWAWPILAAVLLLAIPLVTVLLRQDHGTSIRWCTRRHPGRDRPVFARPGALGAGGQPAGRPLGECVGRHRQDPRAGVLRGVCRC